MVEHIRFLAWNMLSYIPEMISDNNERKDCSVYE